MPLPRTPSSPRPEVSQGGSRRTDTRCPAESRLGGPARSDLLLSRLSRLSPVELAIRPLPVLLPQLHRLFKDWLKRLAGMFAHICHEFGPRHTFRMGRYLGRQLCD